MNFIVILQNYIYHKIMHVNMYIYVYIKSTFHERIHNKTKTFHNHI